MRVLKGDLSYLVIYEFISVDLGIEHMHVDMHISIAVLLALLWHFLPRLNTRTWLQCKEKKNSQLPLSIHEKKHTKKKFIIYVI